jgi:hypothetical protein
VTPTARRVATGPGRLDLGVIRRIRPLNLEICRYHGGKSLLLPRGTLRLLVNAVRSTVEIFKFP